MLLLNAAPFFGFIYTYKPDGDVLDVYSQSVISNVALGGGNHLASLSLSEQPRANHATTYFGGTSATGVVFLQVSDLTGFLAKLLQMRAPSSAVSTQKYFPSFNFQRHMYRDYLQKHIRCGRCWLRHEDSHVIRYICL